MTLEKLPSDDLWKLLSVFDDLLAIEKGLAEVLSAPLRRAPGTSSWIPFQLKEVHSRRREVILELFERQAGL